MADNTYNGWTNWETWIVNVWIDNDQKLHEHYRKMARAEISSNKRSATFKLSVTLREQFDEWMPEVEGVYLDLLSGAMREIDWVEIARHLIEGAEEEENYAQQAN